MISFRLPFAVTIFFSLFTGVSAHFPAKPEIGPALVRVATHGQGFYAHPGKGLSLEGRGIDYLKCALGKMNRQFAVTVMPMARSKARGNEGLYDIWFPVVDDGRQHVSDHFVGPIGTMSLYWILRKGAAAVTLESKVSAFPGSAAAAFLKREGYDLQKGSDDANRMVLSVLEGEVDALLAPDFRSLLAPGALQLADSLEFQLLTEDPVGFRLQAVFQQSFPAFKNAFQQAVTTCQSSLGYGN
ncbi:hypothetical protein [Kordiimonas aestuarii]|uniref:hypothetical protein n=1 Tax=Kordiimonas aestuarii TaxID=1005925 RepID=UPI0021D1A4B2|nr:hypothetical protein [Kordiimonas aestuarii]